MILFDYGGRRLCGMEGWNLCLEKNERTVPIIRIDVFTIYNLQSALKLGDKSPHSQCCPFLFMQDMPSLHSGAGG
jgi:hypothetical protein